MYTRAQPPLRMAATEPWGRASKVTAVTPQGSVSMLQAAGTTTRCETEQEDATWIDSKVPIGDRSSHAPTTTKTRGRSRPAQRRPHRPGGSDRPKQASLPRPPQVTARGDRS